MPEQNDTIQDEAPVEEQEVVGEGAEEAPESDPKDEERREQWAKYFPDIPFDEVSPEVRADSYRGLAAKGAGAQPAGDAEPSQPSVPEVPQVDRAAILKNLAKAVDEGDGAAAVEAMQGWFDYDDALLRNMLGELDVIGGKFGELTRPQEIAQAIESVPDAEAGDKAAALELYKSGEVKTAKAAVKLAVFERKTRPKPRRVASEESRRKAQGMLASETSRAGRRPGKPAPAGPVKSFASKEGVQLLEEAAAEEKKD